MKKAFIDYVACVPRMSDVHKVKKFFIDNGWEITRNYRNADIILLSTCGVIKEAEDKSIRKLVKFEKNKKEGSKVVIFGCLPKINPKRIKSVSDGTMLGVYSLDKLEEVIGEEVNAKFEDEIGYGTRDKMIPLKSFLRRRVLKINYKRIDENAYYLRISYGCLGKCSYCNIKLAIGNLKSIQIKDILHEFDKGLKLGYKRFVLVADDPGAYGRDIGTNFVILMKNMLKRESEYQISICSFNPRWWKDMRDDMIELFKSDKLDHLYVPVQSGSNRILKLMNRGYTVEDFKDLVTQIRKVNPNLLFRTDVIVGFPGETEEDFRKTLRLINDLDIEYLTVLPFSQKVGTPVYPEMQIPRHIILSRKMRADTRFQFNRLKRAISKPKAPTGY